MRNEHEQETGYQREVSTNRSASRSWEHDRDTLHRTGHIRDHRLRPPSRPFATVYTTADAVLLAEVDEAFGQPSGPAIKRILWRQYHVFGDERFERLARISSGHIYNLRGRRAYRSARQGAEPRSVQDPAAPTIDASINPHLRTPPWALPPARSCSSPYWKRLYDGYKVTSQPVFVKTEPGLFTKPHRGARFWAIRLTHCTKRIT